MKKTKEDEDLDSIIEDENAIDYEPVDKSKRAFISQSEILSILLSKETLYHVLVLLFLLVLFGFLSFTKSDLALQIIISLGYGLSLGYFFYRSK